MPSSPYEHYCADKERNIRNHLADPNLNKAQLAQLRGFRTEFCKNRNLTIPTQESYLRSLSFFGIFLKKDFKRATKDDITSYLEGLEKKSFSVQMWARTALKVFYRWLLTGKTGRRDPFPKIVGWIRIGYEPVKKVRPEDVLSSDELKAMFAKCKNLRDKAYLKALLDTGGRAGELLNSRIENIHLETDMPYIVFPQSKTDPRPVYLTDSINDLRDWLKQHPQRRQAHFSKCFIFVPLQKSKKDYLLSQDMLTVLQRIGARAGIKKRVWNHLMRHTSGSFDARANMNTPMANVKYGWKDGSRMFMKYAHITPKDVGAWARKQRGLQVPDEQNPRVPKICQRCKENNPWDAEFCGKCAHPLSEKAITTITSREEFWKEKFEKHNRQMQEQVRKMREQLDEVQEAVLRKKISELKK